MAETIKGINVVIGAETTGLTAALSDVTKKSKDIQSELKQVDKLLKLDPSNTELLAQKQELLGKAVETTRERLDRLRAAQAQVNDQFAKGEINEGQYRAFQRELAATEAKLKDLEKAAVASQKSLDEIGKSMQEAGKKMSSAGTALTKGVTAPIVGLGAAASKASIDFESAFAGVIKTVDATDEELASLRQGIRDMSKEIPTAATEIAGVAEAAGQLGIEVPNIMSFTRTMSDLGVATNMSAQDAATALARLANITQMPQTEFDKLGSVIVALGNNLATTESEIVAMGLRLAGAGSQIGLTEAQILSFAGALSSVGIEAEAGGSAFSKVMVDMQLAAETGSDKLAAFAAVAGMSADEFGKAFKEDAASALIAFIEGLGRAESQGSSAIKVLDDMGISEIRLRDTLLRASGAGELFTNSVKLGTAAWEENVALTNEAEQRYATTESKMTILWNRIKDVAVTLGDALVPALTDAVTALEPLLNAITSMANGFAGLSPAAQKIIIAISAIAAVIGPVIIVIGKVVAAIGSIISAISAMSGAVTAAGGVMAVLTGPIGLTIAAVVALAAAAFLIIKNWEPIKDFFVNLWDGIVSATVAAWEGMKSFFTGLWEWISSFLAQWGPLILTVIAPFIGIPLLIFQHWETIKTFMVEIWGAITSYLSGVWEALSSAAGSAFSAMFELIKPIFEGVKTFFSGVWEAIKNIFAGAILLIVDMVTGDFENLSKDAQAIWNNLKDAFGGIWDGIKQVFTGAVEVISTVLSTAWGGISSAASTAWDGMKTTISTIVSATSEAVKTVWNATMSWFQELPEKLYTIGTDMFTRMKEAVTSTVTTVKDAIVTGMTTAMDWLKKLPDEMMKIGKSIIQGLVDGIKNMLGAVGDAVKGIADKVTGGIRKALDINSPSRVMEDMGEYTGAGFAKGIGNTLSTISTKASDMAAAASEALRGTFTPTVNNTQAVGQSIAAPVHNSFADMFRGATFQVRSDDDIKRLGQELGREINGAASAVGVS